MYVAPAISDLGSFQDLTLGMHAATGAVMNPIGSLLDTVGAAVGPLLPGVSVDDNSQIGTDHVTIDPSITISPR